MSEPVEWLGDGTPYSPRFADRYHSENGGLEQARETFFSGCGLPEAWAGAPQWRILETGFGPGLNFLVTWAAWKADPQRPRLLHFVSVEAYPVSAADLRRALPADAGLQALGEQLAAQWWGLLPGVHRLSFEGGQVLLTLYIGEARTLLRKQQVTADSVYLDGFSPGANPELWDSEALGNVARHCRRGTRLATWCVAGEVRQSLARLGFEVRKVAGVPPKRHNLQACFSPRWEPRRRHDGGLPPPMPAPARCLVIGAGLAGAAAAASLARRGWQVTVLDAGAEPASGASGLPAGLFNPHVSPDDSVLSRLSRSGVRTSLQTLLSLSTQGLLQTGRDWQATGVLEHDPAQPSALPASWLRASLHPGLDWSRPASHAQLAAAGLPTGSLALWHERAGWVRPAALVRALLDSHPGIRYQGNCKVHSLRRPAAPDAAPDTWQALDAKGLPLGEAGLLILALGPATAAVLAASGLNAPAQWPLQPIRGQVSLAAHGSPEMAGRLPPFPVNGNGNLVPDFPMALPGGQASQTGRHWIMGSTFERDITALPPTAAEQRLAHQANAEKLAALLPSGRQALAEFFAQATQAHAASEVPPTWSRVRLAAYDRLPVAGPVGGFDQAPLDAPGLWALTALGSRGLSLALLCAELLAAQIHGEPLPLDAKLATALGTARLYARGRGQGK